MAQHSARIVGDCTRVFNSEYDLFYICVNGLKVAIVGSSLVNGPSCSSLSDGVVSCSSLDIVRSNCDRD